VEGNVASTADRGVGGGLRFGSMTRASTVAVLIGNRIRGNVGSSAAVNTAGWPSGAGGLELWLASSTVSANSITGNVGATAQAAYCGGAAIHTGDNAAVTFVGNDLRDNVGGLDGSAGGGLCLNGAVIASSNAISGNRAATTGAGRGGGVALGLSPEGTAVGGPVTLEGNTIQGNTAGATGDGRGGGVALGLSPEGTAVGGPVTLEGNTIQGNTAGATGDGRGGGVYVSRKVDTPTDPFTVTRNLIAENVASVSGAGRGGGVYLGPSMQPRLDANTIVGNRAISSLRTGEDALVAATTSLGGGAYLVNSHEFSLTNNVVARNQAAQGSGLWLGGNLDTPFDINATWGQFLHTTLADNQGGAGAWLEAPLPAGALTDPYSGGVQVLVNVTGFYRVGDDLLFLHTNGTTRAWRRLIALEYVGSKVRLTLDSALPPPTQRGRKYETPPRCSSIPLSPGRRSASARWISR